LRGNKKGNKVDDTTPETPESQVQEPESAINPLRFLRKSRAESERIDNNQDNADVRDFSESQNPYTLSRDLPAKPKPLKKQKGTRHLVLDNSSDADSEEGEDSNKDLKDSKDSTKSPKEVFRNVLEEMRELPKFRN